MTIITVHEKASGIRSYTISMDPQIFWKKFYEKVESMKTGGIINEMFLTVVQAEMNPYLYTPSSIASQHHKRGFALRQLNIYLSQDEYSFIATYCANSNLAQISATGDSEGGELLKLFDVFARANLK